MNVHDSEKVTALLVQAGLVSSPSESDADLLVINTCSIRDKAEHQLYSDLGLLRAWKAERPGRMVAVGGCVAEQVGDKLLGRIVSPLGVASPLSKRATACFVSSKDSAKASSESPCASRASRILSGIGRLRVPFSFATFRHQLFCLAI